MKKPFFAGILLAMSLTGLALLSTLPYDGNLSAILRIQRSFGESYNVPPGIVLYENGGYDGELYYQIARNLPQFIGGTGDIPFYDNAYRYQRISLPLLTYVLSLGNEYAFPLAILCINIFSLVTAFFLFRTTTQKTTLHTLTIVGNPAALVGLLFSLTEPLNLLFLTAFFVRWHTKKQATDVLQIVLLTCALFTRETTLFLIGLLGLVALYRKTWRDAALLSLPILLFGFWQYVILLKLGALPMANGASMIDPFYLGIPGLLYRAFENLNMYTLSSLAFLFLFIVPLTVQCIRQSREPRERSAALFLTGGLLLIAGAMNVYLWGNISSIGRVIPPLYPAYALLASTSHYGFYRIISFSLIMISVIAALGITLQSHSFILS